MTKHKKLVVLSVLVFVLGAIFLGGCGAAGEKNKGDTKGELNVSKKIRVGYFPNITHTPALVGLADGTFKRALGSDITIEEHRFNAGPAEIEALLAGEIDLGYVGPVPAINGYVRSKGALRIIAGVSNGGAVLVARQGLYIQDVSDLDGKQVAIPQLGNTQDISLRNLLAQAKLKDAAKGGTVAVVPAENADILTLMAKGDVDAALVPEPWGSIIEKETGAALVLDSDEVWRNGKYATTVVIVSTKFLQENPALVEQWLSAHVDIVERINKDMNIYKKAANDQIKKITQKGLSQDILDRSFTRLTITNNPEKDSITEFVKLALDIGYIKGNPDISKLFYFGPINKILAARGLPVLYE